MSSLNKQQLENEVSESSSSSSQYMQAGSQGLSSHIRRVSEDAKMIPFLSTHFNSVEFVNDAIRSGKSEQLSGEIAKYIVDVNEEIQAYITKNKDQLMGGMQGVAQLADRYSVLSVTSGKLQRGIVKLKTQALESHKVVQTRTLELERIQTTSAILRYVRQFSHASSQMDHSLAAMGIGKAEARVQDQLSHADMRQLSALARTINELEVLLKNKEIKDIAVVNSQARTISRIGVSLREIAQNKLLIALKDKDQATMASCLQLFFNLQSLPEILLLAVDTAVKGMVDVSRESLDLNDVVSRFGGVLGSSSSSAGRASAVAAAVGAGKKSNSVAKGISDHTTGGSSTSRVTEDPKSETSARSALLNIANTWSAQLFEQGYSIYVLQKVLSKKEDPTTHVLFLDAMATLGNLSAMANNERQEQKENGENAGKELQKGMQYLYAGRLVHLFWDRLTLHLHDVIGEKVRLHPIAALKLYPLLRRGCAIVFEQLTNSKGVLPYAEDRAGSYLAQNNEDSLNGAPLAGMFGTALLPQASMLAALSQTNIRTNDSFKRVIETNGIGITALFGSKSKETASAAKSSGDDEAGPVVGLKPMRDRYLLSSLQRMTHPIHLMFPELEGYTAAIPSKRDMMEFTKAIIAELTVAAVDSDGLGGAPIGLLHAVCREAQKAIHLMLSKIEGMVMHIPLDGANPLDIENLVGLRAEKDKKPNRELFNRSSQQENNVQLWNLLVQVREVFLKLPELVSTAFAGSDNAAVTASIAQCVGISNSIEGDNHHVEEIINTAISQQIVEYYFRHMNVLAVSLILNPILDSCTLFCKFLLCGVPQDKSMSPAISAAIALHAYEEVDEAVLTGCSAGVRQVYTILPTLLRTHLQCLHQAVLGTAKSDPQNFVQNALVEICLRILSAYVSAAALIRPVTEAARMRMARDMTALETLFSNMINNYDSSNCLIFAEFRSFRRFIFNKEGTSDSTTSNTDMKNASIALTWTQIQSNFSSLRPSTVLHHILSCAPTQMPAVFESQSISVMDYFLKVTAIESCKDDRVSTNSSAKTTSTMTTDAMNFESVADSYRFRVSSNTKQSSYGGSTSSFGSTAQENRDGQQIVAPWFKCASELAAWHAVQAAVDIFIQRTSVNSDPNSLQGKALKSWADVVLDIGSIYFETK